MVTFNPSFPGLRAASLYIDSNDSDENPFDVALVGTGTGDGGVDPDFDPGADGQVAATAVQPDGKFLLGGDFTSIDGTARNHLARLNADGTLDPGFNPDANDGVQSIAVQADGKCLMGGLFTTVGGTPRNHLARLNANGSLDATFDPGVDGTVYCIALQTDEKIVIAGAFTTAAATGRNHVARLNTDGTLDTTFDPDTNGTVFSMMVQPDGKILIGGDFTVVDGTSRNHIARLNADGSLDTGFNPDVNSRVSCMALQADGKILVGGQFEFVGGDWHRSFARLNPDGSLDNEVQVDVEVSAFSMALQVDGKILIGGEFWGVGGYSRGNLARLNANGTLDQSFNPSADAPVYGVTLQADGGLVIGGQFTEIDGTPRNRLARLLNDASSQSLSVPSSSQVVWQRDGTAPETTRVTFDLSTDGSNWTPLGEGTRISGGWELTSLSLPESGTIRARARTHGGQYGGSSGLIEQQAAFSPMPEIAIEQPAGTDLVDGSSTIDCGAVVLGTSGALKTFTIINQGEADLTGIAVTLGGDHPGDFQVDDPGASALAPGASTTFHVAFVPTALGTRAAVLHLGSNDSDENPFDIHLTGTATGDGLEEPDFCPSVDGPVYSMAVQMDGKVLIGGQFNSVGGEARANFARLNADGTPDAGFAPEVMGIDDPSSAVYGTAVQDDGKIVIGGQFITVDGTARNNLARLAADGSLDTGFNPEVNGIIHCMALQADGKILIAGGFTGIGGTPRNRIARLHADGTVDAGFNPNTDGPVRSMALQPDGRIVIGGEFMSVGGASHDFLARLNGDGTPDTGFNPDVNEMVYVTALQPDGKILIGGAFIEIGSEWRPGFARLHQDGTLDDDFNTEMDGYVSSIVLQADGDIVIGGDFSVVGGYPSFRIARLNTNGGLDLDFNPWTWVWEPVSSLALQADGQLLIGSYFDFEGGEPQNHLARALNGAASRILTVPNAARVEWQRDGTTPEAIQVIFEFSTAGLNWSYLGEGTRVTGAWELTGLSLPSNGWIRALARISSGQSNGSSGLIAQQVAFSGLAPALPEIAVEQPVGIELEDGEGVFLGNLPVGTNGNPRTFTITNRGALDLTGLAVTADGLHPGDFIVSGLAATTLAPDASTTFNVTFTPNASGSRSASLHIASNDSDENPFDIPLGGFGASVGTADGDFQLWLEADAGIYSTTVQADGSILIGGDIWWVGGREQYGLARLNDEGSVDTSFNPHISDHPVVLCSAMQPDGRILIGGWISTVGGMTRNGIARLNANGTLDTGFNPDANGSVSSMAVQADGRILIAGGFTTVGGTPRSHLARLNPDGTLDTGFNPEPDNSLFALALQADGKIVIGGTFESVGGTNRHRIARLNADGTLDAGFDPNVDGGVDASVLTLVVQADGRILAGGDFDSVGGTECANLARLNADGTLDCGFHPCPNSRVLSLALQADGRIVMAGEFNGVGGTPRNFIARLNSSGSLDTGFDPQPDSVVYSVALQPDGRIVLGGEFSMVGDTWSPRVTRLLNDPSVQSLTVPNTTRVQWQRAGSAPETTQVTFELSTDGTIWTNLGNGTRVSSAWELTGLSLPASGMVRARARTTCGQYNGSSGLVEQLVTYPAPEIAVEQPVGNELVDGTARYDFGNVRVGTGSQALSFTISNRGINDLTGLATALEGQMAADFEVEGPDVTTLASGTDTTITIVFTPAALGTRNVVLHIASNDTDENPFDIVLTGKGVPEGGVETNFDPTANWSVYTAAMQADGKIVIAGGFTAIDGTARNRIARLHADGSLDPGFDPDVNGTVYSTAVQADGKIVIAGGFTRVGGTARNSIARLNPDGSLDPTFDPDVDDAVYCTALQPDGKIVIGGWFTGVGGMPRNSIARLNADGTLDTAFDPDADLAVYSAVVQPDGRILIGGWFTSVSGTPRDCIARLHSDGSLDNGFDTDADDAVLVMVLQSDGEILIGGDFTTIDGTPRNHIARLHADGTLDTGFDPDAGDSVGSIALQADGRIVIGGYFTIVAGTGRNYIARLNANGTLDEGFDPDADYYVYGTAIEAGGTILIGGAFSSVGGTPRNSIARLLNGPSWQSLSVPSTAHVAWHRAGTAPEATRVTFDHSIDGIDWTPLGQGTRVSGGWELTGLSLPASGTIRARARTTGGLYNGSSGWVEQRTNYPVPEIAVEQPAGTNLIDGAATIDFGNVVLGTSGTARTFIITNTGTTDLSGLAITMDGDHPGDFAVGTPATTTLTPGTSTTFTVTFSPVNPGTRNAVLHLASNDADENPFDIALTGAGTMDGNPDSGFKPNVNGGILGTAVQPDGKILIAGQFTSVGGIPRNHIARLHADGTLDADFNPDANENVCNIAVQADGKIVIVGFFTTVDGTPRNRIARLHADGSLDARFDPNPNSIVYSTALQADGKIVIGGWFTTVGGTIRNRIARLHADGTLDSGFTPPDIDNTIYSMALQADGKVVIGGWFTTVGGTQRNRIARLHADGSLDISFDPDASEQVFSMAMQADGKILIGGQFTAVGGLPRNHIARLHPDGTLDNSFDPNPDGGVYGTAIQSDGKILLGGDFTTIGGTARACLARLHADGTPDPGFNPNVTGGDAWVMMVALQADGEILIGGSFGSVNGTPRNSMARLLNGPATQTLSVPSVARVDWQRGGTSPETSQVTFDLSTDGTLWTTLGFGSRISGGWELTGLSLPASGTIRARARTAGGEFNGSSGLVEQQLAFTDPPLAAPEIVVDQVAYSNLVDGVSIIDFGEVKVGESTGAMAFTISNEGDANLTGLAITTDGSNSGDFTLVGPESTSLAPGASTTFSVTFTPTASGSRSAAFHLVSNDSDESPFDIGLSGTGLTALEAWRLANFGISSNTGEAANTADADHDGVCNLFEFAFDLDPHANSANLVPQWQLIGNNLICTFTRPAGVSGITYGAEWSPSMAPGSWLLLANTGTDPGYTFSLPIDSIGRKFVRLVISAP
jgi:uncharacterized delta-60 repeat protein